MICKGDKLWLVPFFLSQRVHSDRGVRVLLYTGVLSRAEAVNTGMDWNSKQILKILDDCWKAFTFPAMDNGYVYLAASRLTLFRSEMEWAIVIEVFGFSPRARLPDTSVYTFGSSLNNRKTPEQYVNRKAHENYLKNNPNNEFYSAYPTAEGSSACE
jgi:hypothetical protein